MDIKNIKIYIETASEIMGIPFTDITNNYQHQKMKYVIMYALEFGFSKDLILQEFGKYRSYFTMIKKRYPELEKNYNYIDYCREAEKLYNYKISLLSKSELEKNRNDTLINNLRDRLLYLLQENKQLKYKITYLQKDLKRKKIDNKDRDKIVLKKIKKIVLDYNLLDDSSYNAKYIMKKITALFFGNVPITNFEKRKFFINIQKKKNYENIIR